MENQFANWLNQGTPSGEKHCVEEDNSLEKYTTRLNASI